MIIEFTRQIEAPLNQLMAFEQIANQLYDDKQMLIEVVNVVLVDEKTGLYTLLVRPFTVIEHVIFKQEEQLYGQIS
ncbi:hypothetical protein NHG34_05995 [Aerococcaceae bacterium NML190938]|nr:hypothetical protein [Aerococcaceae bacterium NML190938]